MRSGSVNARRSTLIPYAPRVSGVEEYWVSASNGEVWTGLCLREGGEGSW